MPPCEICVRIHLDRELQSCHINSFVPVRIDRVRIIRGMRQGGLRTFAGWNKIDEVTQVVARLEPAFAWAPEWREFQISNWANSVFLAGNCTFWEFEIMPIRITEKDVIQATILGPDFERVAHMMVFVVQVGFANVGLLSTNFIAR